MSQVYARNVDEPDEVIEVEKATSKIISLGGVSLSHDIHEPGWRWTEHVRPVVGTEWCETRHVGYVLSGRMRVLLEDGTEFDLRPGDLMDIPAGCSATNLVKRCSGWVGGHGSVRSKL
jgi:hypothetical protein